jgi:hypothetical protein
MLLISSDPKKEAVLKKSILLCLVFSLVLFLVACETKSNHGDGGQTVGGTGDIGQTDGSGETYRFVWLADSRGETLQDPVNTPVVNTIVAQIGALSPKPSFVVFGGDMAYRGYIGSDYTFQAWKNLFAPLTSAGVALYTTVGNHELYHQHSAEGFMLANQQAFQNVFSENPANGPTGYEHLVYSFTSPGGSAFFAVLDPYYLTADIVTSGLGGNIDSTQMNWLTTQVAQTKAIHKFLFIHTPYYYVFDDPDEASSANATFTNLWAFLDTHKFDIYACGHSHLYSRKTIDSTINPNPQVSPPVQWNNNVVQLLNGTAGAGPSTGTPKVDPTLWNIHNAAQTYYFSVVDINGRQVTVNSYGGYTGTYTVMDTFTVVK